MSSNVSQKDRWPKAWEQKIKLEKIKEKKEDHSLSVIHGEDNPIKMDHSVSFILFFSPTFTFMMIKL